jgi:hypothetical protein
MNRFNLAGGTIITIDIQDIVIDEGKTIRVTAVWK